MAQPIVNPELPFVGEVPSGLQPGKMIRFQGVTHPSSDRFNINLSTGPSAKPRDDTALHLSVRLNQGYIARNSYKSGSWDDEQGGGKLPIGQAESFEIILLVDPNHYKIAVNGQHFCEFPHRIPFDQVTHLLIDGDVSITLISFEGVPSTGDFTSSQASQVNADGPQFQASPAGQYGPPPGAYGAPPPGAYGAPPPNSGGYGPPPPPEQQQQSQFGGLFEQAQDILAVAIKSGAAESLLSGLLSSSGQGHQQPQGYAPQNAKYGIYPDLPAQDGAPSDRLIAGSGGTVTSGPAPAGAPQPVPGPFESLLSGLLTGGKKGDHQAAPSAGSQPDALQGFLTNLLGAAGHPNPARQTAVDGSREGDRGATAQPQSDALHGFLTNLLAGGGRNPTRTGDGSSRGATDAEPQPDALQGFLRNLVAGGGGGHNAAARQTGDDDVPPQDGAGEERAAALTGIFQNLLAGGKDRGAERASRHQASSDVLTGLLSSLATSNKGAEKEGVGAPPPAGSEVSGGGDSEHRPRHNAEMLTGLLQGLLSKSGQQYDRTHPDAEQARNRGPDSQYGLYPHPPQQEQKGPVESLLSGILGGGGGGGPQQQQHGSQGGLGSVGGILGSLAGSLLHKPDQNQGH